MLQTIKLQANDNSSFIEINLNVANMSKTIDNMIKDLRNDNQNVPIILNSINSNTLNKVIEYCQYYIDNPVTEDTEKQMVISKWYSEFCPSNYGELCNIIRAAYILDIKPLLKLTYFTAANTFKYLSPEEILKTFEIIFDIKYLSPEEIRKIFNIKSDFNPEKQNIKDTPNEWYELHEW